jgi:hypothetical protein
VSKHVLERLSARSVADKPPVRSSLVRDFCCWTNWRNRKGQLCRASANVALNRLEKQGLVKLPPPAKRSPRKEPRRLVDDPMPLPKAPRLGAGVPTLTLQLIQGQEDPDHRLWNRLIIREHPLKAAPLVGAQLRYLVRSPEGVIGALGVGHSGPGQQEKTLSVRFFQNGFAAALPTIFARLTRTCVFIA